MGHFDEITMTSRDDLSRIGRTPLMRIRLMIRGRWRHLWLKLEHFNPGGSIKDRTAYALIEDLEERGELNRSTTIVESTSGNLGVALAMVCRSRGYEFIAVTDPIASEQCISAMRRFHARIERVTPDPGNIDYLSLRLARVKELLAANPSAIWPDQYRNPANPRAHRLHTAPEILRQAQRPPAAVFVAVSTGGTLVGISRYMRVFAPECTIVAVDVQGSAALGGTIAKRHIPGIGSTRRSSLIKNTAYDRAAEISEAEAIATCHALRQTTNISLGGSSGAVVAAAARYAADQSTDDPIVCVCPDGSDRYESTLYNPNWLLENEIKIGVPGLVAFDDADCL